MMVKGASESTKCLKNSRSVYLGKWHKPVKSCGKHRGLAQTGILEQEEEAAVWHQCERVGQVQLLWVYNLHPMLWTQHTGKGLSAWMTAQLSQKCAKY